MRSVLSRARRRRRRTLLALLAEFAHDLCDVNIGGHLGLLLLLQLPEDDGAETGPSLLCILLQLGITGRPQKKREERERNHEGRRECMEIGER